MFPKTVCLTDFVTLLYSFYLISPFDSFFLLVVLPRLLFHRRPETNWILNGVKKRKEKNMLPSMILSAILPALALATKTHVKTLGTIPRGTWLENIALRPNGAVLTTQIWPAANIWTVKKPASDCTALELIAVLPKGTSAIGITAFEDTDGLETYVVTSGNFTFEGKIAALAGTFSAWTIKFPDSHSFNATVKEITSLGETALAPNGILNTKDIPGVVLFADCYAGNVGVLNVASGHFQPAVWTYPEMGRPQNVFEGINGIKIFDGHLYWTNTVMVCVFKAPIQANGYPVKGAKPQLVANFTSLAGAVDDFELDKHGNIYAATNLENDVLYADVKTGKTEIWVGGIKDFTVEGIAALALVKDSQDEIVFYGATSGGIERPIDGISGPSAVVELKRRKSPHY